MVPWGIDKYAGRRNLWGPRGSRYGWTCVPCDVVLLDELAFLKRRRCLLLKVAFRNSHDAVSPILEIGNSVWKQNNTTESWQIEPDRKVCWPSGIEPGNQFTKFLVFTYYYCVTRCQRSNISGCYVLSMSFCYKIQTQC